MLKTPPNRAIIRYILINERQLMSELSRRQCLKLGLASIVGATMVPKPLLALNRSVNVKQLSFYNTHTGEKTYNIPFWVNGEYIHDAFENINHVLRDHRTNQVTDMDPYLLDQLHALQTRLDKQEVFHIISGYRSQKTNDMLRGKSKKVAKKSFHTRGKAIDIRLPGVETKTLRNAAMSLKAGGVGFYSKSRFVHMDTGPVRSWGS